MKRKATDLFVDWLIEHKLYDLYEKEVKVQHGMTVDEHLHSLPNFDLFPGEFVKSFTWARSVTQPKDKAYDFWNSVHWRWKTYIHNIDLEDKSETHQRSW